MLMQHTLNLLSEMKLKGMVDAYLKQSETPNVSSLSFEERFGLIVDHEWTYRQNRKLVRLLRQAKLRIPACMEDIDYEHPRGLQRSIMQQFASCHWIHNHQNVLVCGATGVGKTYIACALGNAACRQGLSCAIIACPASCPSSP